MVYKIDRYEKNKICEISGGENRYLSGSYTVEMALLFPLILGVMLFSLSLTFYIYNLCTLDISANLVAIKGQRFLDMSEKNKERKIRKLAEEEIKDSLIAMENLTVTVQIKKDKVFVSYNGKYTLSVMNLLLGGSGRKETISVRAESVMQNAVEWIQTIRKAGRIVDYIKGSAG